MAVVEEKAPQAAPQVVGAEEVVALVSQELAVTPMELRELVALLPFKVPR